MRSVDGTAPPRGRLALYDSTMRFTEELTVMSERELVQPHPGDKRFQRRKEDGTFGESDDASRSLSQDARQHSSKKKPRNEGDKGD